MQVTQPPGPPADHLAERIELIGHGSLAPEVRNLLATLDERGPALLAPRGKPEAAVMGIMDFRLLRAAVRFYAAPPDLTEEQLEAGVADEAVAIMCDDQARYDLVGAHFLSGGLGLSRAAGLLGTVYADLRSRLHRLGLPTRRGPTTIEDAREEVRVATSIWGNRHP